MLFIWDYTFYSSIHRKMRIIDFKGVLIEICLRWFKLAC